MGQRLADWDRHAGRQQSDAQLGDDSFLLTTKPPQPQAQPEETRPPAYFPVGRRQDGPDDEERPSRRRLEPGPAETPSTPDALRRGRRDGWLRRGRAKGRWRACLQGGGDGEGVSGGEEFGERGCCGSLRHRGRTMWAGCNRPESASCRISFSVYGPNRIRPSGVKNHWFAMLDLPPVLSDGCKGRRSRFRLGKNG